MKTVPLPLLLCLLCACGAQEIVYQDPDTSKSNASDEEGDNGDDRDNSNAQDCPINNPAACPFPGITVDPDTGCVCAPLPEDEPIDPSSGAFRFVLIKDEARNPQGDTPGADIDAIGLIQRITRAGSNAIPKIAVRLNSSNE